MGHIRVHLHALPYSYPHPHPTSTDGRWGKKKPHGTDPGFGVRQRVKLLLYPFLVR